MADKSFPVGGDTAFRLLYKDQTGGIFSRGVYAVAGTGNFKDVAVGGDTGFKLRFVEVSSGVYALGVYRV